VASASEDASVKIWDWEGGEAERTVKGHTKAVMDVDFSPKGNLMGEWAFHVSESDMCASGVQFSGSSGRIRYTRIS
jgi:WD40 repeat protein